MEAPRKFRKSRSRSEKIRAQDNSAVHLFFHKFCQFTKPSQDFTTNREGVLYLWNFHNVVNARVSGSATDDPLYPKQSWPQTSKMSDDEALAFLLAFYAEDNISYDHLAIKTQYEDIALQKRDEL